MKRFGTRALQRVATLYTPLRMQSDAEPSKVVVSDSAIDTVKIVSLANPPVNTLTDKVMSDLLIALRLLATPESGCRGVILTSQLPTTFSSGLDLNVLIADPFDAAKFAHYWAQFQELFLTLHSYPLPLVAAINGHAPAAGCIMACACDYRVMARRPNSSDTSAKQRDFSIGITATRGGFCAPPYVASNLAWIVGRRVAEDLITCGKTLTADEAHAVGLVDDVVEESDQAVVAALEEVERYLQMPAEHTRWLVKDHMRRPLTRYLKDKEGRAEDCLSFSEMIQSPVVVADLRNYVASLSKRPKSTGDE